MKDPLLQAIERLIPKTCLPSQYANHQEFCDDLVMALAGDIAFVPKVTYDALVAKVRRYDALRKNLPEVGKVTYDIP